MLYCNLVSTKLKAVLHSADLQMCKLSGSTHGRGVERGGELAKRRQREGHALREKNTKSRCLSLREFQGLRSLEYYSIFVCDVLASSKCAFGGP